MMSRIRGLNTSMKTSPSSPAATRLLSRRNASSREGAKPCVTSEGECARSRVAGRKMREQRNRPARLDVLGENLQHRARFPVSAHEAADMDADRAAAGEPDAPCRLVLDAEFERLGLAACDHVGGLGDHFGLDASAGDRAHEIAVGVDQEQAADRLRR